MNYKPIFPNDLNAPRMGKGEFSKQVVNVKLWRSFRKTYPEYKDMTWSDFARLWDDIAETIREEAIKNPLGVKLGSYTGEIKFQFLPHKFQGVDIKTSTELGEKVPFLGITQKGKQPKIKWERKWAVKFNKMLQFFGFEPHKKMGQLTKEVNMDRVRTSKNTLGGYSVWRQIK